MTTYNLIVIPAIILAAVYLAGRKKPRHLLALAVVGFSVVYGPVFVGRLQVWNVFHYYLGAKYFGELGYYEIYNCALYAGGPNWVDFDSVRNLHRYSYEPAFMLPGCPLEKFTPDRMREFQHDVQWLHQQAGDKPIDELWPAMFRDKGLNTTPFWLAIAAPLANLAPVGGVRFWLLLYSDFGLIVAGLVIAGRRFGLERVALAAVFLLTWPGTYPQLLGHWFQYPWLFCVLAGVSWYRDRPFESGAALTSAAALRVFPAVLFLIPLAQWRKSKTPKLFWTGVSIAGALWALLIIPIGPVGWVQFVEKMFQHSAYIATEPGNFGIRNLVFTLLDWPGSIANWEAFARGGADLVTMPGWISLLGWFPAGVFVGSSLAALFFAKKPLKQRFSTALPALFGVLVLSRYYYAINAIYALESEPKRTRALLGISLAIFGLIYFVHPVMGYLVGQVALMLFYWREVWA